MFPASENSPFSIYRYKISIQRHQNIVASLAIYFGTLSIFRLYRCIVIKKLFIFNISLDGVLRIITRFKICLAYDLSHIYKIFAYFPKKSISIGNNVLR